MIYFFKKINFNKIRMLLINQCCFCIWWTKGIEMQCVSKTEITASEYIRLKKYGHSDSLIWEITGYHY